MNLVVDDGVEEAAGQGVHDVGLKFVPGSRIGNVGLFGRAATAGEQGDDAAFPVEDNSARVSLVGEGATPAVGQDGGLERGKLKILIGVVANERLEPVEPAHRRARGQAVLDDRRRLVAIGVQLIGVPELALRDYANGLEEAILRVRLPGPVLGVGEHQAAVLLLDPATCGMKQ